MMAQNTDTLLAIAGIAYHGARFQYAARGHRGSPILSMDPAVESRLVASRGERCLLCPREGLVVTFLTNFGEIDE